MIERAYCLGLDFGTNSVRALLADAADGREVASAEAVYASGRGGVILEAAEPDLARQHPGDYVRGLESAVLEVLDAARRAEAGFSAEKVIGLGAAATGSTPLPVDRSGRPLALSPRFREHPAAQAWLWKDHTAHEEAGLITGLAQKEHPEYLAKSGGAYSSEWFFSKIFRCLRIAPEVFDAAWTWVELSDFLPALLTGTLDPARMRRNRCAAGHKAMWNEEWGGLPSEEFLGRLDSRLAGLRRRLYDRTFTADSPAGGLSPEWSGRLGLRPGTPVACGALDAHLGAVGSNAAPGRMVKIIGTSTCDIVVWPKSEPLYDIPGLCGIVDGSVLPGFFGLEAGQSAVGDIFHWFVNTLQAGGPGRGSHEKLAASAAALRPGESGLLALDWNNGNRTVLVDQRLTGLLLGQTLQTEAAEIYRALIEATAFGALVIINRLEEYGVRVEEIVACGGIVEKNPLLLQIYADVLSREIQVAPSGSASALGAAMAGAVAAGTSRGGHGDFPSAQRSMCAAPRRVVRPQPGATTVYGELFRLYVRLHDAFGKENEGEPLYPVMKDLLALRDRQRRL